MQTHQTFNEGRAGIVRPQYGRTFFTASPKWGMTTLADTATVKVRGQEAISSPIMLGHPEAAGSCPAAFIILAVPLAQLRRSQSACGSLRWYHCHAGGFAGPPNNSPSSASFNSVNISDHFN
jgi:hypothetical protein